MLLWCYCFVVAWKLLWIYNCVPVPRTSHIIATVPEIASYMVPSQDILNIMVVCTQAIIVDTKVRAQGRLVGIRMQRNESENTKTSSWLIQGLVRRISFVCNSISYRVFYIKNSNLVSGFIYSNYLHSIIIKAWATLAPNFTLKAANYILTRCKVRPELFLQTVMSAQFFRHKCCHELFWEIQGLSSSSELTHWSRVTHICVNNLTIIGSDNGLSPGRRQAIIWTNAGILFIGPLETNSSEILIEILTFSFKKMRLKVSSGKWRPFCLSLNVLTCGSIMPDGDIDLGQRWLR